MMNWYKQATQEYEPLQMSEDEFVDYHKTGTIPSDAYEQYSKPEGLSWLKKENYPILYSTQQFGDKTIEFRKSGEELQYVKQDEDGELVRDKNSDLPINLTKQEMMDKNLPLYDTTIVAFDGDQAIGWASNEFGADGVFVIDDYQGLGIGLYLLKEFRKQFKNDRKMGQMTGQGENLARAYYRDLIRDKQ